MESLLTYIGSIASVLGIPLAIYLFLKSREEKINKIRREIIKIISYQVGENRRLDTFEIEKVINSNVRNNKLAIDSITVLNTIEDLISDTISSPLLSPDRKDEILKNLKEIFPASNSETVEPRNQVNISTYFAAVTLVFSMIPMLFVLFIGQEGWSERVEWWVSLNTIKGYLPNVVLSIITASLGLLVSITLSNHKKKHNKSSNADAKIGAGS